MKKIRVFLADDHAVLRAGLKSLLNAEPDLTVVGEASGKDDCLSNATANKPDVILLDINMPGCNGLELIPELRQTLPRTRILILTMHDDPGYLRQALAAGCAGYVLKQAADTELLSAIRTVYSGGVFLHPAHTKILLEDSLSSATGEEDPDLSRLSERETDVLRLIALGYTNKEIAQKLFISVKTVETYKARIMEKLNIHSRAAMVRFALKHNMLEDEM